VTLLTRSLLLDPDYKGVYVNLGMAYLRLHSWERCIEVCAAGERRHPDAPQFPYHRAIAYCQLALGIVNAAADASEEMARLRELAATFEERKAKLEAEEQKAREELALRDAEYEEALKAKSAAQRDMEEVESKARRQPIDAGAKLKARISVSIFASFECWDEIGTLRPQQVVTAAGPEQRIESYPMVPIEPCGVIDRRDMEPVIGGVSREAYEQREREVRDARSKQAAAKVAVKTAKRAVSEMVLAQALIPRRPAAKLLGVEQWTEYEQLRLDSLQAWQKARDNEVSRGRRRGLHAPWLEVDDEMFDAMETAEGPIQIELPTSIGWQSAQYRL